MPNPPLPIILKHLPNLKAKELAQVKDRINFLLGISGEIPKPIYVGNDWLLEGLTVELRRRGLWLKSYPLPAPLLPQDYPAKGEAVRQHLIKGIGQAKLVNGDTRALGVLGASVLMAYLTKIKVPVGPKTVLNNLDKIPLALEESFPGYWAGGMLKSCL